MVIVINCVIDTVILRYLRYYHNIVTQYTKNNETYLINSSKI